MNVRCFQLTVEPEVKSTFEQAILGNGGNSFIDLDLQFVIPQMPLGFK